MKLLLQALRASCKLFSGVLRIISGLTTWRVDRGIAGRASVSPERRMQNEIATILACDVVDEQRWL